MDSSEQETFLSQLALVNASISLRAQRLSTLPTNSTLVTISHALDVLPQVLPEIGLGLEVTTDLLLNNLCPALSPGHAGPRYFGLVTGGVTPIAQIADQLVTSYDPNVQIHLPEETISTIIEHQSLNMLLDLLSLSRSKFTSNTFTTGATASNILGLSLAREYVVNKVLSHSSPSEIPWSVAENGMAGISIDIFCAGAHTSIAKAASFVGIGRSNTHELSIVSDEQICAFDLVELERRLKQNLGKRGSVVVSSFGEVNTGGFNPHTKEIRKLCDQYDAWLHIDAAFGAFAVLHPDFSHIASEMNLADSITSDAHKWLSVPYDCGIFFSRSTYLNRVAGPGQVSLTYLASTPSATTPITSSIDPYRSLPPPLFSNIENSRRFRALPVYATLVSYGKDGIAGLIGRNIQFARKVEKWMREGGGKGGFEVLTPPYQESEKAASEADFKMLNIVLFAPSKSAPERYQGQDGSVELKRKINESQEVYVTGTKWRGRGAIRIAVSNWGTEVVRDYDILVKVLERVMTDI